MLSDGSLDTLAKCEHCGKVERFAAYDEYFPAYEIEVRNSAEGYRSMVGTMMREVGHDWQGPCQPLGTQGRDLLIQARLLERKEDRIGALQAWESLYAELGGKRGPISDRVAERIESLRKL